jgi:hypothetical protein
VAVAIEAVNVAVAAVVAVLAIGVPVGAATSLQPMMLSATSGKRKSFKSAG